MHRSSSLGLVLLLVACEELPPVPAVTEPQGFTVTSEVWSGSSVTITSPAFAAATTLPLVLLDDQPLSPARVDDTTLIASVPDAPGAHTVRVIAQDVVTTPVLVYLRGYVDRIDGPALSGRLEPGRDPRYLFGSGPTSLRRWNLATNKAVDLGDSVHAVSCTRGVGPGPNIGELVLLTGGCEAGKWMLWRTEPLAPLSDTTSVTTTDFVAVLRTGRWVVLDGGAFSVVACDPGEACTSEDISGLIGSDVVRSPRGDRAALVGQPPSGAFAAGVPVLDLDAGRIGYRTPGLTAVNGAAFSPRGDTLFLVGDSAGARALVAIDAGTGQRLASRALGFVPCAALADTVQRWLYVAGLTTTAPPRSVLQVLNRATLNTITTLHVTTSITYGSQRCRIVENPISNLVYVVETSAVWDAAGALAQLYRFETPR